MGQQRILFLGDSLIAFNDWQKSFERFDCVSLGIPGETVEGWLPLTGQAFTRHPRADFLVVMLGANNLCQQDYSFLPSYLRLLGDLRGYYVDAKIMVCSLLPHELPWLAPTAVPRLNDILQAMVTGDGHLFLDLYAPFLQESSGCFLEDGVHLSEKGYNIWCGVLAELLDDYLFKG